MCSRRNIPFDLDQFSAMENDRDGDERGGDEAAMRKVSFCATSKVVQRYTPLNNLRINWTGLIVFAGFCLALWAAISRPAWMPLAEGAATVLILFGIAGLLLPRVRRQP
jgi:hypothetical protein